MVWTTTDLLADVRRRAMLPTTSTLGATDADILAHADNEMASRLVPLVTSVNEEFYVQTMDFQLTGGQAAYRMPNRSAGGKLRDVTYLLGASRINLARIEPEQLTAFIVSPVGMPTAFYLEAGAVNLVPAPAGAGILRMAYYVRPGRFTSSAAEYGVVTSVTYSGNSVTIGFSGSLTTSNGSLYDVIAFRPPFEYLLTDGTASASGAGTVTLTVPGPSTPSPALSPNIAVGDYICARDKSPILQLPVELHSLLAQRVVCAIFESLAYAERLEMAERVYARMEQAALRLITPRVDGAPRKMRGLLNSMSRFGTGLR